MYIDRYLLEISFIEWMISLTYYSFIQILELKLFYLGYDSMHSGFIGTPRILQLLTVSEEHWQNWKFSPMFPLAVEYWATLKKIVSVAGPLGCLPGPRLFLIFHIQNNPYSYSFEWKVLCGNWYGLQVTSSSDFSK